VKYRSFSISNKRTAQLIVVFAILLALFGSGCRSVSPRLQDEYIRPGLSEGMCRVFAKYRQRIPEIMAEDKVPGLSLALVDRDGILWATGFGYTDDDRKMPVTTDTMFAICSMSKTITATAVMIAVQDGLVDLDTPISRYLPDFTVNSRFEERPLDKMTLRHLLTHTAGFTHDAPIGNLADIRYGSFEEHVLSIQQTWLKFRVGERCRYSNLGIDLAAYILQVESGRSFQQYVKEKVFDRLGMPDSSVDYGLVEDHPNRAQGHVPFVSEFPIAIPMVGAGGVYTTARELSRFVRFHLNRGTLDGQTILEPRFVDAMCTTSPISKGYGLGISVGEKHDSYSLNHGGAGFGFLTQMTWYPEYGIGCIALTNSETHNDQHMKITDAILDRLITQKIVAKDTSGAIPTADVLIGQDTRLSGLPEAEVVHMPTPFRPEWKRYVRTYRIRPGGYKFHPVVWIALALGACVNEQKVTIEEKDGFLWVRSAHSQGRLEPLEEYEPGLFFTPAGEALDFRGPLPTWRNMKMEAPWLLWSIGTL